MRVILRIDRHISIAWKDSETEGSAADVGIIIGRDGEVETKFIVRERGEDLDFVEKGRNSWNFISRSTHFRALRLLLRDPVPPQKPRKSRYHLLASKELPQNPGQFILILVSHHIRNCTRCLTPIPSLSPTTHISSPPSITTSPVAFFPLGLAAAFLRSGSRKAAALATPTGRSEDCRSLDDGLLLTCCGRVHAMDGCEKV